MTEEKFIEICEEIKNSFGTDINGNWRKSFRETQEMKINKFGFSVDLWYDYGENVLIFKGKDKRTNKYLRVYNTYRRLKGEIIGD